MFGTKEIRDAHVVFENHIAGESQHGEIIESPCDSCIYALVNAAATSEPLAPNRLCTRGLEHYNVLRRAVKNFKTNGA